MTPHIETPPQEQLALLGVDPASLGRADHYPRQLEQTGQGFAATSPSITSLTNEATSLDDLAALEPAAQAILPTLDELGVTLTPFIRDDHLFLLQSEEMVTVTAADPAGVRLIDTPTAHLFLLDSRRVELIRIDAPGRGAALISLAREQLSCWPIFDTILTPPELVDVVDAPVQQWLDTCADAWLREELSPTAALRDPWAVAHTAGALMRLREDDPAARLAAVLSGKEEPARRWARALPPPVQRTLIELIGTVIAELDEAADLLLDTLDEEDAAWCDEVLRWRHRRDELESVCYTLFTATPSDAERERLDTLRADIIAHDRVAAARLLALPRQEALARDELLQRAHAHNPDAWWTRP